MPFYKRCIAVDSQGQAYIEHHGINGQKWGVRNGPPYPLDFKSHSKAEQRLNPKSVLDGKKDNSKSKKEENKEIDMFGYGNKSNEEIARDVLKKNPNAAVVNPDLKKWVKDHKKELLIGAGVVGIAAVGVIIASNQDVLFNNVGDANWQAKELVNDKKVAEQVIKATDKFDNLNSNGGFKSNEERFIAQWLKADMHRYDAIKQEDFLKLPDDDGVTLEVGEKMFRMSKGEHSTLRDGIEYVSFGEDRDRYKGFLPQMWRANGGSNKTFYEAELKALTTIKAPGKKESIEILEKVLKKQHPGLSDEYIHRQVLRDFNKFQVQLIDRDYALGKKYLEEARSRGYNAVIDFNDAGRLSDKPLILLNGSKQADISKVQAYNIKETKEFFKNIKLPTGTEDFNIDSWNSENLAFLYTPYIGIYAKA